MWRTHISKLMELYTHYKVISALEQGLTRSIESLKSPTVSNETAQVWRDVWKELAGDRFEFQLSLRLLNAAVRYRESQDQRILLELPVEERSILNSLLKTEEPSLIEQEKTRKKRNKRKQEAERKTHDVARLSACFCKESGC